MKILIADKFQSSGVEQLKAGGFEVVSEPNTDAANMHLAVAAHQPHVLVVRGTKVGAEAIRAGQQLSMIVRAGAGFDSIDVAEASRRGVYVATCPGKNSIAVAGIGFGGEGHASFTIASPTGHGVTSARHFTRERRCTIKEYFRIL